MTTKIMKMKEAWAIIAQENKVKKQLCKSLMDFIEDYYKDTKIKDQPDMIAVYKWLKSLK